MADAAWTQTETILVRVLVYDHVSGWGSRVLERTRPLQTDLSSRWCKIS